MTNEQQLVPIDAELEARIIGAMLLDPQCVGDAVELVTPKHFYYKKYSHLCEIIYKLWEQDETLVTVAEIQPYVSRQGITIAELVKIAESALTSSLIAHDCTRLKDLSSLRNLVMIGREMAGLGHLKTREEIREAINRAERKISQVTDGSMEISNLSSFRDALGRYNIQLHEKMDKGEAIVGIPSGFQDLDYMTTGFKKQDLIIVAARPSMGKTAFSLDMALKIAGRAKKKVLFFELEMSEESIVNRMVANIANLDSVRLSSGMLYDEEHERYIESLSLMDDIGENLFLDTTPGITVTEIKAKARKIKKEHGLDVVFVDYLGLIGTDRNLNRYDAISENTRMLKNMARELDVPVIALCQLSRAVEQRQDKRPMLSDLRESGEIEQTADLVMFLYRDDYYNEESEKKNITEVILGKHRNGPIGKVELLFLKNYSKFLTLEPKTFERVEG